MVAVATIYWTSKQENVNNSVIHDALMSHIKFRFISSCGFEDVVLRISRKLP